MSDFDEFPFRRLARFVSEASVVPFLGAGVNLADRPEKAGWQHGKFLPNGYELTNILAQSYDYPPDEVKELKRVSEFVAVAGGGPGELYKALRSVFNADYPATTVHRFLASTPSTLRAKGCAAPYQLIVTTNYDDILERAFDEAGEPYDLVVYIVDKTRQAKLTHVSEGNVRTIGKNQYDDLPITGSSLTSLSLSKTLILKLHGAVDRNDPTKDSYVITEDDYVDYLARRDIARLLPAQLLDLLKSSHLLFLGYSITDWNLRVVLNRIWAERAPSQIKDGWAIQREPSDLDKKYWQNKGVTVADIPLALFTATLQDNIQALPTVGP